MSTDASAFLEFLGKTHEEALEFLRRVPVLDGTLLIDDALAELRGEKLESNPFQCFGGRCYLLEDVATLAVLLHHADNATDLSLDTPQASDGFFDRIRLKLHIRSFGWYRYPVGYPIPPAGGIDIESRYTPADTRDVHLGGRMQIEQVEAGAWQSWVEKHNAMLLDVREPFEWAQTGVLPGSKLISMGELPVSLDQIPYENPILVVCRTGNRSQHAAAWLISNGYRAANLAGGVLEVAKVEQDASES